MRAPAGAAVLQRVIDLEHDRFLAPLQRKPEPLVIGIVADRIGLADPVRVAPLGDDQIVRRDGLRVAHRQRKGLHRIADRPPHLDDGEMPREQAVGFVRQQIAHALRSRPFGVIVVHPRHDFADLARRAVGVVGGAQGVIEHHDALGAALLFDQVDHLRIIDIADLRLVEEIGHGGFVPGELKAFAVERRVEFAPVANDHGMRIDRALRSHLGRAAADRLHHDLLAVVLHIIQRRLDRVEASRIWFASCVMALSRRLQLNLGGEAFGKSSPFNMSGMMRCSGSLRFWKNYRNAAAILPPSTVVTSAVVFSASAWCRKACATSSAVTSRRSRLPAM